MNFGVYWTAETRRAVSNLYWFGGMSQCVAAVLWQLRKQNIFTPQPGWMWFLMRLIISVLVMAAVLFGVLHIMPEWCSQGRVMAFAAFDGGSDRGYARPISPRLPCWALK